MSEGTDHCRYFPWYPPRLTATGAVAFRSGRAASTAASSSTVAPGWIIGLAQWQPLAYTSTTSQMVTASCAGEPAWPKSAQPSLLLAKPFPHARLEPRSGRQNIVQGLAEFRPQSSILIHAAPPCVVATRACRVEPGPLWHGRWSQ